MARSTLAASAASLAVFCAAMPTAEAAPPDASLAEVLFQEGKRLMIARRFAEACPKLAESYRLDAGGGTLLSLALCHEKEGKLASAWVEFKDAEAMAKRDRRADRQKICAEHVKAIEPKLQMLTVIVGEKPPDGLEVKRDGVAIGSAAFGTPFPIDPGEHRFTATAPHKKPWSASITIRSEKTTTVEVPKLEDDATPAAAAPAAPSTSPSSGSPTTPSVATDDAASKAANAAPDSPRADSPSRPYAAYALLGVGAIGLGVGGYFGLDAASKRGDADARCPDVRCSDPLAVEASKDAVSSANVANVAIGAGVVAAVVGTILLLTSSSHSPRNGKAAVLRW